MTKKSQSKIPKRTKAKVKNLNADGSAKLGRPTLYTEEVGDEICRLTATSSKGLETICNELRAKDKSYPAYDTVVMWIIKDTYIAFSRAYARAKEQQAEHMEQEIISLADKAEPDKFGRIEKDKLRVDARKWVAAKLKPKKYGDKPELFLNTKGDQPEEQNGQTIADRISTITTLIETRANVLSEAKK